MCFLFTGLASFWWAQWKDGWPEVVWGRVARAKEILGPLRQWCRKEMCLRFGGKVPAPSCPGGRARRCGLDCRSASGTCLMDLSGRYAPVERMGLR